jgi:hypothetical protein
MTTGLKIWRLVTKPLFALIDGLGSNLHTKNLRQSFDHPVISGGRDSFRYYERGHWTTVSGELMSGSTGVDRIIYRRCPMKWNDTGEPLTEAEKEKAFQAVGEYLDKKKVRWKFSDAGSIS